MSTVTPNLVLAIVSAAVELAYAGVEITALIKEAQANDGKLSNETLKRVENEVKDAHALWDGNASR